MPAKNDHPHGAEADSDAPEAAESPSALAQGLPAVAPDLIEEIYADEMDNIVPARNYNQLPVVALGGSAGSIQAFKTFFQALPAETGMVYVVILHLSPNHVSTLPELLQATTPMPVRAAQEAERLEANRVYVIPPGKHLLVVNGHLRLTDLEPERGRRVTVDMFFRTLADTHGSHATAIVLSGADGDGSIGLKRIKERGGLTIAQDPEEAEHASMPKTAIDTGMVDWVLRVADMPARILEYRANESTLRLPPEDGPQPAQPAVPPLDVDEAALREVLSFLRARTDRDFTYYKRATIVRRISRRLQINGIPTLPNYVSYLRTHPGEAGALLQDLLISVTNFFRDRDTFAALEKDIIPALFAGKGPEDTVRAWSAACATGEEPYSLAMLLVEHARTLEHPPAIQVFGCDLDEEAIEQARAGIYTHSITADVSEERLARFFVKDARGYRVRRELREIVLFAEHDLLKDAPFSKLDLASCRNLLIYLNREAQNRALEIFHFALKPEGKLFLGNSESVPEESNLFETLDKKHRFYVRRNVQRASLPVPIGASTLQRVLQARETPVLPSPIFSRPAVATFSPASSLPPSEERTALTELHFRFIERCAPPSVMVNEHHDIVHLSENAGRFMQPVGGPPTLNLLRSIHPALRAELRGALFQVVETGASAEVFGMPMTLEGVPRMVDLRVAPAAELAPGYLLVSFAARDPDPAASASAPLRLETEIVVRHLEQEVEHVRGQLRDTVERYEASAEEYKSSHEELQSMNEELRSASEELETGREELQSINEELNTVNHELKTRVDELGHANSDLHNLMNATNVITVFLDRELKITRYTPNVADLFFLIPTDIGRPLAHIKQRLDYSECEADAEKVLRTLVPIEREVDGTSDERWFLVRLQPYRTTEDHIGGLVLTFVDITERRQTQTALRRSEDLRRIALEGGRMGTWRWDLRARLIWGDPAFLALWGIAPSADPYPVSVFTCLMSAEGAAAMEAVMAREVAPDEKFDGQLQIVAGASAGHWIRWRGRAEHETPWIVNGVSFDVTEQRLADERVRESEAQFRSFVDATSDTVYKMSADWTEMRYLGGKQFLADTTDTSRTWLETYIPSEDRLPVMATIQDAIRDKRPFEMEHRVIRADGTTGWTFSRAIPLLDAQGEIREWIGAASDVTERRHAEAQRRQTEERLRLIVNSAMDFAIFSLDLERRVTSWSPGAQAMLGYEEAEILGQPIDIIFTPEDRAANAPALETERAKAHGRAENERYHLRRGGERFYGSGMSMALREDDGTIIGYVKIMRDLTEAKRTTDALRESEARFRTLTNAVPQVIWTNESGGKANYFNGRWFEYSGLSLAESIGLGWQAIVHPDDAPVSVERWQRALSAGEAFDTEYRLRRADGAYRWHIGRNVPLKDEAGRVLGWFGSATDTEDLVHARAEAQAANAAKDQFLAILSHELRTPLTPITMALAALDRRQDVPEPIRRAHKMIQRNVELETHFIDDMLDVTRIARGKMEIVRQNVDLHEAIHRAVEVSSPDIEAKGQRLTVALKGAEHTLSGDFARLQQVFWNLLKNASKFTPEAGKIHLLTRNEPGQIVVEVTDTGIGMEADAIERIFQPFEQASIAITREFGGLGLGLAIAKATVEAHGGALRVSSPGPGQSATFTVSLPLIASE